MEIRKIVLEGIIVMYRQYNNNSCNSSKIISRNSISSS